jgi:hypothetical protein
MVPLNWADVALRLLAYNNARELDRQLRRQVTAKSRFARAVAAVSEWCRKHRHWSTRDQHRHLSSMMRGHFAYYGVGGNARRLCWYSRQVVRIWQKWLSRRDRQSVVRWARLNEILQRHPLPPAKIFYGYAAASESSREEHVRVCEGWGRQRPHLLGKTEPWLRPSRSYEK